MEWYKFLGESQHLKEDLIMNKVKLSYILFLICFGLSACSMESTNKPNSNVLNNNEVNIISSNENQTTKENLVAKDHRVEGIELDIGSSYKDVIAKMKEPNEKGYFEAGLYLDYGDIIFFTDSVDESIARINAISIRGER